MVHNTGMTKAALEVDPGYLVPLAPRSAWDGWFAIAIFPGNSPLRWLKAHFYNRVCTPGWYPLSLLEAIGERTEMLVTWASAHEVEVHQHFFEGNSVGSQLEPLRVEFEDSFLLEGTAPHYRMSFTLPGSEVSARFEFETGWPIWWAKFGRLLRYVGQHSRASVELVTDDGTFGLEGLGVMEHVAGTAVPFDFPRFVPLNFHWDVLAFDPGASPFDSAAGLSVGFQGKNFIALRAGLQLPGDAPSAMRGLWVKYLETAVETDADGRDFGVPLRWEGMMRNQKGTFRYEATAATPPAGILPGGAMLGFDFVGRWVAGGSKARLLTGTGFSEYGDFSGRLAATTR
jgi:hypothetical protein